MEPDLPIDAVPQNGQSNTPSLLFINYIKEQCYRICHIYIKENKYPSNLNKLGFSVVAELL